MPYSIVRSAQARLDIRGFVLWLKREAGVTIARRWLEALERDLEVVIANSPHAFPWFHEAGQPYPGKVFRLAPTTYWIIHVVDEERQRIEVVRFWNPARQPETHGL